jgi:hypothetical protein
LTPEQVSHRKKNDMKKLPALAGTLLVTALCISGCAPAEENRGDASEPIRLGPDGFPTQSSEATERAASDAALNLQTFFAAVDDEADALSVDIATLDQDQIITSFPRSLRSIDTTEISKDDTDRLIREYADNVETIPNKGYVGIDPKALRPSADGTVAVSGEDLFIVYKEGTEYVTRKGASMTSDDSLNDVFTMAEVDGTWKITQISF